MSFEMEDTNQVMTSIQHKIKTWLGEGSTVKSCEIIIL